MAARSGCIAARSAPFRQWDAAITAAWQDIVSAEDEVWHLGDFALGRRTDAAALLAALPGRKHLITGNNDPAATTTLSGWSSVQAYAELTWTGRRWCFATMRSAPGGAWAGVRGTCMGTAMAA